MDTERTLASLYREGMEHIVGEPHAYRGNYRTKEDPADRLSRTVWHDVDDPVDLPGKVTSLSYGNFVKPGDYSHKAAGLNEVSPEDGFFLIPLCSYSDYSGTTTVERSNFEVCLEEIEEYDTREAEKGTDRFILGQNVWTVYGGHGTTALAIRGSWNIPEDCELYEFICNLYDYPVISEEYLSKLELEVEEDSWNSWIRSDMVRSLERKFSGPEVNLDLSEASEEGLKDLYREFRDMGIIHPVFEDPNGCFVDIDKLGEACTLDDIYRHTGILPEGFKPSPGDFILSDTGNLGSRTLVTRVDDPSEGREFNSEEKAMSYVLETMERENFFPNVWRLSDHGNLISYNDPRQLDMEV